MQNGLWRKHCDAEQATKRRVSTNFFNLGTQTLSVRMEFLHAAASKSRDAQRSGQRDTSLTPHSAGKKGKESVKGVRDHATTHAPGPSNPR